MIHTPRFLVLGLLTMAPMIALASGCAADAGSTENGQAASTSEDLSAAKDPVVIANAKTFFQALLENNTNRDSSAIAYAQLPGRLGEELAANNGDPKAEWAAEAFRAKVRNGKGNLVTVYAVIDGIDDEGETITVYTTSATMIAEGDDYRGFVWNH